VTLEADLLAAFPAEVRIPASLVADAVAASNAETARMLVVLDDDPTGTQSVADLPVLTRWDVEDFEWAFSHIVQSNCKPAVYVLTNTRSLDPAEAAVRNEEVVRNALAAAAAADAGSGLRLGFVSRSDSTLRGHYPLEPDVIAATVAEVSGEATDGVVLVPAFPDAGRVTIGGVHYTRGTGDHAGTLTPAAETEFAKDASFGYTNSELAKYVEEKSKGRFAVESVIVLDLNIIRAGSRSAGTAENPDRDPAVSASISANAIADAIAPAAGSTPIVADIVTENDLRALSLGLEEAERRGKKLLYRVGPPFGRARIGQDIRTELSGAEAYAGNTPSEAGGLIVVGSHVGVTTRQLKALTEQHSAARIVEIDVEKLLAAETDTAADAYLNQTVGTVVEALRGGDVIVHTSRLLIKTDDAAESLRIARTVSAAVVAVVNRTLKTFPPRFVIAKGGITSSDVAAHGLEIRHAIVRGPMLPGIVSLWEPVDGPAKGIPYIVFAGNVGDDQSLADVTRKLSNTF
jgi:uncharacterized protein YgbK (DUF1537 family)